jgi:hypothetical protein
MPVALAVDHHVGDREGFSVQSDGLDVEDHEEITQRDNLPCGMRALVLSGSTARERPTAASNHSW